MDHERLPIRLTLVEDGLELQDAIALDQPFIIQRDEAGLSSEFTVSGEFTLLGGVLGVSLEPEVGPFKEGKVIKLEVDYGLGFEEPRGFGGHLLIKNANQYDDGRTLLGEGAPTVESLTVELVEPAGFIQQPEYPQRPYFVELGSPITLTEAIRQTLESRGILFEPQVGDPVPSRTLNIMLGKNDLGDGLYSWASQFTMASPDRDRAWYDLATDNQGRTRFVELDLDAAPLLTLVESELSGFKFGTGDETEQLPGAIEIEGLVVTVKDVEDPEDITNTDDTYPTYRELKQTRLPNILGNKKTERIRKWGPKNVFIRTSDDTNQVLATDSTHTLEYDSQGFVEKDVIETKYLKSAIVDGEQDNLILAERVTITLKRDSFGRITQRKTLKESVWGLLTKKNSSITIPTGLDALDFTIESIIYDYWTYLANGQYEHSRSTTWAIAPEQRLSPDPKNSSAFGPPNYGKRPDDYEIEETKVFRSVPLVYEDLDVTGLELQIYGDGEFFINGPSSFIGFGTYTSGGGSVTQINGTRQLQSNGTFKGFGWFLGDGRFVGKRSLSRSAFRDLGNLPESALAIQRVGEIEAALIAGRNRGYRIQIPMGILPPGWLKPGAVIWVLRTETGLYDVFMISGEEMNFNEEVTGQDGNNYFSSVYQAFAYKVGTTTVAAPSAPVVPFVSVRQDNWVWANDDNAVLANSDNLVWAGN